MILGAVVTIIIILLLVQVQYWYAKAKEFESLYNLSLESCRDCKLAKRNKDGSITKKRGPKPKAKK